MENKPQGVQEQRVAQGPEQNILKTFPKRKILDKSSLLLVLGAITVTLLGIGSGWVLANGDGLVSKKGSTEIQSVEKAQLEEGSVDESSLKDSEAPEGILKEGGIEGEGTHHLERPGGPSQNVYLTSTFVDLHSYVDKKVKVWGDTLSAVHAGWLMDVSKIKILD